MQEISNSLRQRLRARPEPEIHPDPDQLTAYVEQLLPSAERATVVEHLAECSYCREVVALSLPESQQQPVVAHESARSRWWIPAYRWAAAAATVAIAATLVIERPWQQRQFQVSQPATVSEKSQAAPPVDTVTTVTNGTVGNAPVTTDRAEPKFAAPSRATTLMRDDSVSSGVTSGARINREISPPRTALGVISRAAPMPAPPPPVPQNALRAEHRAEASAAGAAYKDGEQDFVNRRALRAESQTVEVTAEPPVVVPEAPSPKAGVGGQVTAQGGKGAPPIKQESLAASTMDFAVAQPQTTTPATPPPSNENTLKSMSLAKKVKNKVSEGVAAVMEKARPPKPSVAQGFSSSMTAPSAKRAETDKEENGREQVERIQWTVTPDGRLLKSTDVGQWHEAYPQGADLQFRFVQQSGTGEVWAGGNHGTLIHSWNAGVNWSKLNVPDSSSTDITAIAIDGDNVQVKTSNGKTFVSDDHGKTWVPLNQTPQ